VLHGAGRCTTRRGPVSFRTEPGGWGRLSRAAAIRNVVAHTPRTCKPREGIIRLLSALLAASFMVLSPAAANTQSTGAHGATRTYLISFDFDSAALTDRARQIIAEAANAPRAQTTRIEVTGHTDTV